MRLGLRRLTTLGAVVAVLAWAPAAGAEPTDSEPTPTLPAPMRPDGSPMPPGPTAPGPLGSSGPAIAPDSAPADSTTLALSELGASDTIWFDARENISSSTISFVIPRGLTPTSLNATLEIPVRLRFGNMTVTQDGRTISRLALPPDDGTPMVIPLAGLEVYGDWASVTLTVTALPMDDTYCWDPRTPVRLVNGSVTFTGQDVAPSTVAEFLPPTLRRVAIAMPTNPSMAEAEATVQLAAAMATKYGWQNTAISVVPLPNGATALPDPAPARERQIIIKEGPDPGLSLQPTKGTPALLITGPGAELTNQTRLLTDDSLRFALSTKAVAGPLITVQRPVRENTTLAKLNQTGLSAESLRPEVNITLDQSMFAQPLRSVRVHLLGSYTPLAGNFDGELTAEIRNEVIARWPAGADGTIDRWVDIPDRLLQRSTALKIKLHTTGDPGQCNDYLNPMLRIDSESEVTAQRASPPVPPGFRSLPQAMMPRVQIGIGTNTFGDTVRAAQIIVGLQRNSAIPLVTAVTSLEQAIASGESAILISPDDWTDGSLTLPFSADLGTITIEAFTESGEPATLTLDPSIKYGSLQTVFDGQRSVLIATSNGASAQLDELLRWLSDKRGRWSDLQGRAIISVPGTEPVSVPNRRTDLPEEREAAGSTQSGDSWIWWAAGAIAVLSLIGAVVIVRRTATSKKTDLGGQQQTEPDTSEEA